MKIACIAMLLCLMAGMAGADWSEDIILWEPGPDPDPGGMLSVMKVDSLGSVHIVHEFRFWHPQRPQGPPFDGLRYVKLDDWGNVLAESIVTDSSFNGNGHAHIVFFGMDSLWVVWGAGREFFQPHEGYYAVRPYDLDGNALGPQRAFQEATTIGIGFMADASPDRTVVLVYPRYTIPPELRAVVQLSNGERILDNVVIWSSFDSDRPHGFIDYTDSIQVVWQEGNYPFWEAIFTKRVATTDPFDSSLIGDHAELTPTINGYNHSFARIQPLDTTRLGLSEVGGGQFGINLNLHLRSRDSYDSLAWVTAGESQGYTRDFAFEGDSIMGTPVIVREDRTVHVRRFRLPDLELISDDELASPPNPNGGVAALAYTTTQMGQRHILISKADGPHTQRLVYRFWRSDLAVRDEQPHVSSLAFTVTPNPAVDRITINGPLNEVQEVNVYDIMGRLVTSRAAQGLRNAPTLSLKSVPAGVYFVRIEARRYIQVQKIVLLR